MQNKIPKVGDEIYDHGCRFIVCEVKISTNPITGERIITGKQIVAP